jgi:hypothetical protein
LGWEKATWWNKLKTQKSNGNFRKKRPLVGNLSGMREMEVHSHTMQETGRRQKSAPEDSWKQCVSERWKSAQFWIRPVRPVTRIEDEVVPAVAAPPDTAGDWHLAHSVALVGSDSDVDIDIEAGCKTQST